ncbi:basic salivary proline-rich protein 4-like [Uloborus diversus]|uniref:basic salivary proline-rich protein 4-like n=1 Tax=Uloborus diversus TaxID=327109 RepID=UPI002409266C|nr:basic salivary proline-rich protein 4-like [Uloborus diversus]
MLFKKIATLREQLREKTEEHQRFKAQVMSNVNYLYQALENRDAPWDAAPADPRPPRVPDANPDDEAPMEEGGDDDAGDDDDGADAPASALLDVPGAQSPRASGAQTSRRRLWGATTSRRQSGFFNPPFFPSDSPAPEGGRKEDATPDTPVCPVIITVTQPTPPEEGVTEQNGAQEEEVDEQHEPDDDDPGMQGTTDAAMHADPSDPPPNDDDEDDSSPPHPPVVSSAPPPPSSGLGARGTRVRRQVQLYQAPADSLRRRPRLPPPSRRPRRRGDVRDIRRVRPSPSPPSSD